MKLLLAALFLAIAPLSARADCQSDHRSCVKNCMWELMSCDMPNMPHCQAPHFACLQDCDKSFRCKAKGSYDPNTEYGSKDDASSAR